MKEKLTPIELNIRSSWAINCAVALLSEVQKIDATDDTFKLIEDNAKIFVAMLDNVKAHIQPPEPAPKWEPRPKAQPEVDWNYMDY